jgi:hypothetical protein
MFSINYKPERQRSKNAGNIIPSAKFARKVAEKIPFQPLEKARHIQGRVAEDESYPTKDYVVLLLLTLTIIIFIL